MNESLRRVLRARLNDQLSDDEFVREIRGTCSQAEFVDAIARQLEASPESRPRVMALVSRLNRRGGIPADLVPALESRISWAEPGGINDGITVDLDRNKTRLVDRLPAAPPVEIGSVLRDRYEVEHCLGAGGKGTVFKALDRYRSALQPSQRHVAVKILQEVPGSRDAAIQALRRELQCAQTLSHPNIVKVYDVDRDGEVDFFTMELLEGELLSDLMRRFQPLPIFRAHAWSIIKQVVSGLEHAHARNIVHADLKPQNIMVTNSGEVRILDFGSSYPFAKEQQTGSIRRWTSSATPAYACCELLEGREPDPRDDLYALACIAYELLTGAHPFQRRRSSEARDFGIVPARPSGLSRRQWRALEKGLAWHRAARSISVGDWFKELSPGPVATQALTGIGDIKAAPVELQRRAVPLRLSAAFGVLLSIAAVSLLFVRLAPGGKVSGESFLPAAAPETTARATQGGEAPVTSLLSSLSGLTSPTQATPLGAPNSDGKAANAWALNPGNSILPSEYRVQRGQHFAEIRVHRPANARGEASLTWWTEPASAKPGIDYVSQAKVSQSFPKGRDSMSFFVKLLPKAKRSQSEVFYIAVADKGEKRAGQITHTAVRLPPNGTST